MKKDNSYKIYSLESQLEVLLKMEIYVIKERFKIESLIAKLKT